VTIRLAIGLLAILWNKDLEQCLYLQPFSRYWPHFLFPRSIVTKSISSHFQDNAHHTYRGHDFDLTGSRDVIGRMTIWFPGSHFL